MIRWPDKKAPLSAVRSVGAEPVLSLAGHSTEENHTDCVLEITLGIPSGFAGAGEPKGLERLRDAPRIPAGRSAGSHISLLDLQD